MKGFIRTVKEFDLDDISHHLLLVGDLSGDCFNCKEMGLDYANVISCPKCKTDFRYIASRRTANFDIKSAVSLHKKRTDLIYIEFNDLKKHQNREKARNLFA